MGRIAKSSIDELHQRLDAVAVVEDYLRLEKRGGRFWGRCPFHAGGQERTPSFTVDPERNLYYCFGCQKGGSIIGFVMEMDNAGYQDTVKSLARKFAVELAYDSHYEEDREFEEQRSQKEELYELYRRTAVTFRHFLMEKPEGKAALEYLLSRNISEEMIEHFRLGYSPRDRDWLYQFLQSKGYTAEFLDGSGLFSANYQGMAFFSDRLMFPIADRQGRIIAFGGRTLPAAAQDAPKYINSRETAAYKKSQILYALDLALPEIRRSKTVHIAEGYLDVIALHQAGITNAVAPLGTAFTEEQARLLRHWAEKAVLVFDSDEAGQAAAVKSIIACRKNGLTCYLAAPDRSDGGEMKDPAEILQKFGAETLKNSLNRVIIDFEYLIARGRSLHDISTPKGKTEAVTVVYPYFNVLDSQAERDACIAVAADEFRLERASVLSDYERWRRNNTHKGSEETKSKEVPGTGTPIRMNTELFLLTVVSVNMNLYPEFRACVDIREIEDPNAKELFIALEECFIHGESDVDSFISRLDSPQLRNFIIKKGLSPEFRSDSKRDPRKLMEDGINTVKNTGKIRRRISEIGAELRLLERNSDIGAENKIQDLIVEKMQLDAQVRTLEGN